MITIKGLQKIRDGLTALEIDSLRVSPGEIVAIISPAGSGKEILFDLLIGKQIPSAGEIKLADAVPKDHEAFCRKVGVMFDEDALYRHLSPLENLHLQCQVYGLPKEAALVTLAKIGMSDQASVKTKALSPGLQRRVAFGRAILHHPDVLLLFEPFKRCDEVTISVLKKQIESCVEPGIAILILSDSPTHLIGLCDRIFMLKKGRLSQSDPEEEIRVAPASFKIPVKLEDKVVFVNPADILYAEAESGRASLRTQEGSMPTQFTLSELEERLSRSGFFRAHRAYLVNLQHIKEVIPFTRNSFSICLDDEKRTMIPLSKAAAVELREMLKY